MLRTILALVSPVIHAGSSAKRKFDIAKKLER